MKYEYNKMYADVGSGFGRAIRYAPVDVGKKEERTPAPRVCIFLREWDSSTPKAVELYGEFALRNARDLIDFALAAYQVPPPLSEQSVETHP
jgi:hypothetical protein